MIALEAVDYPEGLRFQYSNLSDLTVCGSGQIDKICERREY
jgi:hypothetical protein